MQFEFTAVNRSGQTSRGVLAADAPAQARRQLHDQGLFVVDLRPATGRAARMPATPIAPASPSRRPTGGSPSSRPSGPIPQAASAPSSTSSVPSPGDMALPWSSSSPGQSLTGRISRQELLAMTSQLAIMARAGVDLATAIAALARQSPNPRLSDILRQVHEHVEAGEPVSRALERHANVFGEAYVASVAAGEASGRLPDVLERLVQLQRGQIRLRATLRGVLAYPVVLTVMSGLVLVALVLFVLPRFADVFARLDVPLPALTQVLLGISGEITGRWWFWLPIAVATLAAAASMWVTESGRLVRDGLMLRLPLVADIQRVLLTGRSLRLMGTMIESGVPLLDAIKLTQASVENRVYQKLFDQLRYDALNGRGLTDALAASPHVPPGAAQMVATGEQSGTLGSVMQLVGEYYEEESETRVRDLATVLEPIIIVAMGAVVAIIVLSVVLPMFDFTNVADGGR